MVDAISTEEELHWLALRLVPGLGVKRANDLLDRFTTPQAVFRASKAELEAEGLLPGIAQSIVSGCTFEDAVSQQERLRNCGAELITRLDPRYPPLLRTIYDPPMALFVRGRVELLQALMIAVVGTRRPTAYGQACSDKLAADLSHAGLTIISGMARGIDTVAHKAALAVGGDTVAVFGCGVDVVYPSENRKLAGELAQRGLLVSEFPLGTPAYPQNFPVRNRVVAGMSLGTIVVEGAQYSGSSITAKLALDSDRLVFAVPGNITSQQSWGPNLLIKQGAAKLVQDWNDVVEELSPDHRRWLAERARARSGEPVQDQAELFTGPNAEVSREALAKLSIDTPLHFDQLCESLPHRSPSELTALLFDLELAGTIRQLPGRRFVRVW